MFRLTPVYCRTNSVPTKATPMPTETHIASRGRRNSTRTRKTSTSPPIPFFSSVSTRALKGTEESRQISSSTPGGSPGRTRSTQRFTVSLVARVSGLAVTKTCSVCEGWSLKRVRTSTSSKPSTMLAMSPSSNCVPSERVITGISAKSVRW